MTSGVEQQQRYITACHEGGHAVAAYMRGGGEVRSITVESTHEHAGLTHTRHKPCDAAFIIYAGPWAEARTQWAAELPLDAHDDDGMTFDDYLLAAWLHNADGDADDYRHAQELDAAMLGDGITTEVLDAREHIWCRELEARWPTIQQIAALLIRGPVAPATIAALVH
jgi:hypothetical protein